MDRALPVEVADDGALLGRTGELSAIGDSGFAELEERGVRGGVYLGVGPGQNFSYMTTTPPVLAFIVDVRRDNLLQHLWFKALFERSATRLDCLCLMVARSCGGASEGREPERLVRTVESAPPVDTLDALIEGVVAHAANRVVPVVGDLAGDHAVKAIGREAAARGPEVSAFYVSNVDSTCSATAYSSAMWRTSRPSRLPSTPS